MSFPVHSLLDAPATIPEWLGRTEALHRSLRPDLPSAYQAYLEQMFSEGAHMAVLHVSGTPKALAIYRIHHTTFAGLRFYMDDLVTTELERGQGYGTALLSWCEATARTKGCSTFALDSGVQRAAAHRFYFRHGLTVLAFSFAKRLAD